MTACTTLNFSQAYQVTTLEVPVAMLELPKGAVRVARVENITLYRE